MSVTGRSSTDAISGGEGPSMISYLSEPSCEGKILQTALVHSFFVVGCIDAFFQVSDVLSGSDSESLQGSGRRCHDCCVYSPRRPRGNSENVR